MNIYDPFNLLRTKKESIGKPPGMLTYSGNFSEVEIEIDIIRYNSTYYHASTTTDIEEMIKFINNHQATDEVIWINIIGLHSQSIIQAIGAKFDIHPMDLEDIVHVSQWSKILDQTDYLFSIFKMIYLKEAHITHEHVSAILKHNILITFQETPGDVFDSIRNRLANANGQLRTRSVAFLYYALLDAIIDEYIVVINHVSNTFNAIEMQIIEERNPNKEELYGLRKELLYFSNAIAPLVDAIRKFMSVENLFYTDEMVHYYTDLQEHLSQISDSIKAYREMSNSLHEMQMSNASMRMNRTMMTLTIFSAIFIPLSFLAGVFGMNFIFMPWLDQPDAFTWFILLCMLVVGGMLTYFKQKKWF